MAAPVPPSKPAIAALAINIFLDFVMILLPSSVILLPYLLRAELCREDRIGIPEGELSALRFGSLRDPGQ